MTDVKFKMDPITGKYVYVTYNQKEYRIYFEEAGSGIPLVCLHTAGADSREWRHQLCDPDITNNFRIIAFDLPRHGRSIPPANWYKEIDEYKLTSKFYSGLIMAFCDALDLDKPVIMGSSMGGHVCLHLALHYENRLRALIAIEACERTPSVVGFVDWLSHPEINGIEAIATRMLGLMAPQSPEEYRWETWWYYAQGGPGIFKGDLYFYSIDHDFREHCDKISGKVPMYFLSGMYDFSCAPEMAEQTANKVKGSRYTLMEDVGHFPMSENPSVFKKYLMPILKEIMQT